MSRYRVSMDIGGTFTDVVAYDEERGTYRAGKSSTTPNDLTEGVFAALGTVIDSPAEIAFTVHGTTQGLNAFLQRRGERVLLLLVLEGAEPQHERARQEDHLDGRADLEEHDAVEAAGQDGRQREGQRTDGETAPAEEEVARPRGARSREQPGGG